MVRGTAASPAMQNTMATSGLFLLVSLPMVVSAIGEVLHQNTATVKLHYKRLNQLNITAYSGEGIDSDVDALTEALE